MPDPRLSAAREARSEPPIRAAGAIPPTSRALRPITRADVMTVADVAVLLD